jgi:hypothetical protein
MGFLVPSRMNVLTCSLTIAFALCVHAEVTKETSAGAPLTPEQIHQGLDVSSLIEIPFFQTRLF